MGNNPSKQSHAHAASSSSSSSTPGATATTPTRLEPRRRDSIQALPSGKATAAPPSESRESATAHHSAVAHSHTQAHPHPPQVLPTRRRSRTLEAGQPAADAKMGNEQSRRAPDEPQPFNPSRPVDVPGGAAGEAGARGGESGSTVQPAAPPPDPYHLPPSQTHRPPRLPLPIEEEDHTPGSPILSATDLASALDVEGIEGALPRRSSVLSSTTVDEDDVGDELHAYSVDGERRKTVPTVIEWKQGGDKVYVTGTFASWNRKFRLHKDPSQAGLSAVVQLPPGTHHLKFIVDGDMRTSDDMPTAVDYTNILVNYLEVSGDDLPPASAATKPVDIQQQAGARPEQRPPQPYHPPMALSPAQPPPATAATAPTSVAKPKRWTAKIPQYLLDLDQPEDSGSYQRAAAAIATLPPPPSLPLFLNKSILNGNTPMKDDSSVLSVPNHTVLNHLATSSIRSGVLATSATTRYKKKCVTTVLYKPTNEEDD
ncbi:MAG: hypothetical protein M1832_005819 [Thelocarpon impressellum]|nr:MAG: hypothetical protein M1832_005819 [Thelocarpon impressellum]